MAQNKFYEITAIIGVWKIPSDNILVKFPTKDAFPTLFFTVFFLKPKLKQQKVFVFVFFFPDSIRGTELLPESARWFCVG